MSPANRYCREGICYRSYGAYRDLSLSVFGNYQDATAFFVERGYGGAVSLLRRLRLPASVAGSICSTPRMSFLVNLKAG